MSGLCYIAYMASKTKRVDPKRAALAGLGARIHRWRKESGQTQGDVAAKLKVSIAYVSLIERGSRNPPITTVTALARALGVSPAMLIE